MEINKKIESLIKDNEVCLFMKGTPDAPQCGFSMALANVLKHLHPQILLLKFSAYLRQPLKNHIEEHLESLS